MHQRSPQYRVPKILHTGFRKNQASRRRKKKLRRRDAYLLEGNNNPMKPASQVKSKGKYVLEINRNERD